MTVSGGKKKSRKSSLTVRPAHMYSKPLTTHLLYYHLSGLKKTCVHWWHSLSYSRRRNPEHVVPCLKCGDRYRWCHLSSWSFERSEDWGSALRRQRKQQDSLSELKGDITCGGTRVEIYSPTCVRLIDKDWRRPTLGNLLPIICSA